LISIYEEALKLQHKGKLEEAKEKYEQLIDHKFLKKEAKAVK
jgi:outer membrane protein assembly factor BamD (BamD/ComL family)